MAALILKSEPPLTTPFSRALNQGIPAIAVYQPRLQVLETGDLMQRIPGE